MTLLHHTLHLAWQLCDDKCPVCFHVHITWKLKLYTKSACYSTSSLVFIKIFFIQIIREVSREIFFRVLNIHFCTRRKMTDLLCCDVFSYSLKIKGTAVKPSLKFSSALSHPFAFAVQFAVFGKSYHKTGLVAANLYSSWNDEKQCRGSRNCLLSLFQKLSSLRWAWMRAHCYPVANT